jgi:predicted DNA-binding transcriptional regulator AlpA
VTTDAHPAEAIERLIYPYEAALQLGVEVATLQRWHARNSGPPAVATGSGSIAYWSSALEEWKNQLGGRFGLPVLSGNPAR